MSAIKHTKQRGGVRSIDGYAYASGMGGWNAAFKTALAVGTLVLCLAADRLWVSLAVIAAMGALTVLRGGVPLGAYLRLLRVPLAFLLVSGLAVACEVTRAPAGDWCVPLGWFYLSCTAQSVRFAALLSLKALGAVSAMYLLALSTPASELVGVLRRAHLPALLAELMYLIYRFIFLLFDAHGRMRDAAASRLGYRDFRTSCRTFGGQAGNLLLAALRKSGAYYDAMLARGYDGELRFLEEDKPLRAAQVCAAAAFWAALIALRLLLR